MTTPGFDWSPGVIGSTSPTRLNPPLMNSLPITLVGATIGVGMGALIGGVIAEIMGTDA